MFVLLSYFNNSDITTIMEDAILKTRSLLVKDNRFLNAKLLNFDLPVLIRKMKKSNSWATGDLNTMILLKSPKKQIILTALHDDTQIESFQSNDSITLQIIEGSLNFYTIKQSVTLGKGQLLTLSEKLNYQLTSMEDTVFLMTIIKKII
jgi:hypothetical protein